jgi:UDP-galactopyranose mutase
VKINDADLPRRPNIHWLGGRKYDELPGYMSGWEVALLPFALNESTKFISPTKTPEYLAAGLRVVSTPITDVVRPYGEAELVSIASTHEEAIEAIKRHLTPRSRETEQRRLASVDAFLSRCSWQQTWEQMFALIQQVLREKESLEELSSGVERKFSAGTIASAD